MPEDLYYLVEHHVWARAELVKDEKQAHPSNTITVGVTDPFQALTERIMFFTPRRISRRVEQSDPIAILESGKWLGTIPSPAEGEIVGFNPALADSPTLLNTDPYGDGWVARLQVEDADLGRQGLVTGAKGVAFYRGILEVAGIRCNERS